MNKTSLRQYRTGLFAAALIGAACACGTARAAMVELSFDYVAALNPPTTTIAGTSPWLNVQISDTATPGTVSVTVAGAMVNSFSPPQTLTGIWLNIPSLAAGLTNLTVTGGSGTGQAPLALGSGSDFSQTQSLLPSGTTADTVGKYNIFLKFPNSGSSTSFQDHQTETFNLTGAGTSILTANAFYALSLPKNSGPSYYALAAITNANGSAPGGIAYIAPSLAAVPTPTAWILMLSGIGVLGIRLAKPQASRRPFLIAQTA